MEILDKIHAAIHNQPLPLGDEKQTQNRIAELFAQNNIDFNREFRLSSKDIPDFMIDGIAVEVKIKGDRKAIFKQCRRYLDYDQVKGLVLITNRSIGDFKSLLSQTKHFTIINIAKAWL